MNTKGQLSIFSIVFIIIIFAIILGLGLAPVVNLFTNLSISLGGLTGLEAFLIGNLLLWIIVIFIIWALWSTR
jgi:hypothetical protein